MNNPHSATFFASMNTSLGFVSYFREIFDKIDTVYVIKGGSGTGKSRFMREVSAAAQEKGYFVEEFLCSSDPSSLDGIIIKDVGVAILDGTAPHVHEPTLIGARERFVDLSAFLNVVALKEQRKHIESLVLDKSKEYAKIYDYLKIISIYDKMIYAIALNCLDLTKMYKSVEKSRAFIKKTESYEKNVRIRSAISSQGKTVLNSYSEMASKCFAVSDLCGLGALYLKKLLALTDANGISVTVSYDPLMPEYPDALYYPDSDTAFYIGNDGEKDEITINMRRFVNDSLLRPYKAELRGLYKFKKMAIQGMSKALIQVKATHGKLETIYSSAMDFSAKENFTAEFIKKIL